MRSAAVVALDCPPVLFLPEVIGQFHVPNAPCDILPNGNTDPLYSVGGLELVPVSPVVFRELHVVVKDELIDSGDHVEVALPRDVVRLEDSDLFHCSDSLDLQI